MSRKRGNELLQALLLTVVAGALLFAGWGFAEARKVEKAYTPNNLSRGQSEAVPAGIVRLHVIGNSDSEADQEVKLKVRDAIMGEFGESLASLKDSGEAETAINGSLMSIEAVASDCLSSNGSGYGAKASLKTVYFPDRTYETVEGREVFLPEGDYRALQVVLGRGEGQNWWCVMYPPLCYFDLVQRAAMTGGPAMPASTARGVLLIDELSTSDLPVEFRSFILDALKLGIEKLSEVFGAR